MRTNEAIVAFAATKAAQKAVGYTPEVAKKYSIVECAKNEYLHPEYDPFKMLEFTLLTYSIREKYGIGKDLKI